MAAKGKVIITCAVTGAIHTPSMSPHLPVTPEQITEAAVGAAEAGAAIVHLHARDPETGAPDQSPEAFARFLPQIRQRTGAVINLTTGGAPTMTVEERVRPAATFKPEVASLNLGSMNFGLFGMLNRFTDLEHDWERQYLSNKGILFRNTFEQVEHILTTCAENGTRFECECYDTSHLYNLKYFFDAGLIEAPLFVQTVFGLQGGIGSHPDDVLHMKRTADRLFGDRYRWSVLGAGRHQMAIAAMAAAMGGTVRVGLEDSLWDGPGRLAKSNADQVKRVRQIIEGLGLGGAPPAAARALLARQGGPAGGVWPGARENGTAGAGGRGPGRKPRARRASPLPVHLHHVLGRDLESGSSAGCGGRQRSELCCALVGAVQRFGSSGISAPTANMGRH